MTAILLAIVSGCCGIVMCGSLWAWTDLRRRQRQLDVRQDEINACHAALQREHAQQSKALLLLDSKHRALDTLLYDARQDIKNLCEATDTAPYVRGSKAG